MKEVAQLIKGRIMIFSINYLMNMYLTSALGVFGTTSGEFQNVSADQQIECIQFMTKKKLFYEADSPADPLRAVKDRLCSSWH